MARRRKVTPDDAGKAVVRAYSVHLPTGTELLDAKLLYFIVDGEEVANPLGMESGCLEACAEVTTGEEE